MNKPHPYSNWLEIDRSIIANNLRALQRIAQTSLMAVLKANAYGHGLEEIGRVAAEAGVAYLGVARTEEGVILRSHGIETPILVLGYTDPLFYSQARASNITLTIFHPDQLIVLSALCADGPPQRVHIKVDTGMGRLGLPPEAAFDLLKQARRLHGVQVEGIFTHYARADEPQAETTQVQERQFLDLLTRLEDAGLRPPLAHASNSAATLCWPNSRLDIVRPGIALYGMRPSEKVVLPQEIQPALTWKARLSAIKQLKRGAGISYGHTYHTQSHERIGVVPVGYGDGFRRVGGNWMLLRGKRVPVVGRVCMDQCMIQLDHVPDAQVGDEIVVLGSQGDVRVQAEDIAARWGTIPYEVVTGLASRIPRIYIN